MPLTCQTPSAICRIGARRSSRLAAAGAAAEEHVENIVEGKDADRLAKLVDHRGHLPLPPPDQLQHVGGVRRPGHVNHRLGHEIQGPVGHPPNVVQGDRRSHLVAVRSVTSKYPPVGGRAFRSANVTGGR